MRTIEITKDAIVISKSDFELLKTKASDNKDEWRKYAENKHKRLSIEKDVWKSIAIIACSALLFHLIDSFL